MSTFDENLHPRGQAANPGQFKAKENDAPTGSLTAPDAPNPFAELAGQHERAEWVARMEVVAWENRARDAALEQFFAVSRTIAPQGATHAVFTDGNDGDPKFVGWQNLAGDLLDEDPGDLEGHELIGFAGVESDNYLRNAGFELDEETWQWTVELRDPAAARRDMRPDAAYGATAAYHVDDRARSDGALGAFLSGVVRRSPETRDTLHRLTDAQVASLNRDFEAFASLMATKIKNAQEG
ncbi:MAG: hypothetical protein J0J04_04705 [Microbacterium sp.]|uniref:hypothetical protein n=1 Tax=Microbacterium sp. TaxID=51671 RepID=UPI001ACC8ED9|nr:hypothetical protein [Microbacterium sp.]MBN9214108.1 hypothetical protein [Microbacterium sp.]